jgi:tRNA A-37 threonylcarbamoyl transferase component Bud32/outer membrane protein assembly factor BamB
VGEERNAADSGEQRVDRVIAAYLEAEQAGQAPDREELLQRHPELADELRSFFADRDQFRRLAEPIGNGPRAGNEVTQSHLVAGASAPAETVNLAPGSPAAAAAGTKVRYFGDYELLEEIARGGMGIVYKARQRSLNRTVALKMILAGQLASESEVQRFYQEARTAANLQHPNIVAIHEVGQHDGQHYFSMDYVEGQSLADMVRDAPLPASQAGRYVKVVAEAIQYAHDHGVLHRDLKPSNVLIDRFDQPRVTDFGLAKHVEAQPGASGSPGSSGFAPAAALTQSGAVIGTPSYMPPEQASGSRGALGPASDGYSLGAVLYELVTGRPPFRAATALDTLLQVLESEPAPPRLLNRGVNRDLETIILKCLSKEPTGRYASSRELANDLGSVLEGKPIKARRPGVGERALRWLRRQRRSVVLTAATAAVSVVVVVAAVFGWEWYVQWRQGSFVLRTDGLALETEVLDEQDRAVIPPFTAPTRQPVSLPGGQYRLRLSGPRQMSDTYQLLVEQGERQDLDAGLGSRQLWDPIDVEKSFDVVDVGGRSALVLVSEKGLRYLDGATGKEVWRRSMDKADQPAVRDDPKYDWSQLARAGWPGGDHPGFGRIRPWLVQPAPVLERDGTRYLVWAERSGPWSNRAQPWLMALSSKDGTVKWWFRTEHPLAKQDATVVCPPLVADVAGDGIIDVIALFGPGRLNESKGPAWVEAISGRTGRRLWEFTVPAPRAPPGSQGQSYDVLGNYPAGMALSRDRRTLVVVAGGRILGVDVRSGKAAWPARELGLELVARPVFYESGGRPLVLVLAEKDHGDLTLAAIAPEAGTAWQHTVGQTATSHGSLSPEFTWPVVADLDGDGKPAILVPYSWHGDNGWVGVEVLDGATGRSRWRRALMHAYGGSAENNGIAHIVAGPDVNGDGHRDVFTAALVRGRTFGQSETRLFLQRAAVSGADGRVLWQDVRPVSEDTHWSFERLGPLRWCQPGADGRPLLLASFLGYRLDSRTPQQDLGTRNLVARAWLYSAGTGKVAHTLPGFLSLESADLDGDGIPDLYGVHPHDPNQPTKLHAFRGNPPENWRRPGTWYPTFAGNSEEDSRTVFRMSPPLPHGDLDGDGIPDLLVFHKAGWDVPLAAQLHAYSGKDGRRLWTADAIQGTLPEKDYVSECFHLGCRDLKKNGRPQVVQVYGVGRFGIRTSRGSSGGGPNECWLAVFAGSSGKLLWKERIGGYHFDSSGENPRRQSISCPRSVALTPPVYADLNGDGVLDVVTLAQSATAGPADADGSIADDTAHEIRALDGRNGRLLWKSPLRRRGHSALVAGPLRGDGTVDVIVASWAFDMSDLALTTLDGKHGRVIGSWSTSNHLRSFSPRDVRGYTPQILADLDGNGRRSICFTVQGEADDSKGHLVVLDWGRQRCTLDVKRASPQTVPFRLWNYDLDGEGKDELVYVSGGKVRAVKVSGEGRQPSHVTVWEWPLPGAGDILGIQPAGKGRSATVAMWSGSTVYGLDGATGQPRWRCDGPGQAAALLPAGAKGEMPGILFHIATPESTVCRQAVPVGPDGKYLEPATTPIDSTAGEEQWKEVPLPWEWAARQHLGRAALLGLACMALLGYAAWKRTRPLVLAMLACLFLVPLVPAIMAVWSDEPLPDQRHGWGGWYLLWPFALSAPADAGPLVMIAVAIIWCLRGVLHRSWQGARQRRRLALMLGLIAVVTWLSYRPGRGIILEQFSVSNLPDGVTWKSPLIWMIALLIWPWPLPERQETSKPHTE